MLIYIKSDLNQQSKPSGGLKMSFKAVVVHENRYADSVTLMGVGDSVKKSAGVLLAEVQMGTPVNLEAMRELGFKIPAAAGVNDLIVAIEAEDETALKAAQENVMNCLDRKHGADDESFNSLDEVDISDGWNLCQISLPGEFAAAEAEKAINKGMDVFIFSDNVSLEEELHLKQLGEVNDVLVMGPDCGVGMIDGVALATMSIVNGGPIGIVGASGSGAQEVACIVEKAGSGISALIGTGGRDLYPQIGGLSMIKGMKRLAEDSATEVIVLVSKLADRNVMDKVLTEADKISKPVVAIFLGGDESLFAKHEVHPAFSLEAAALKALELCGISNSNFCLDRTRVEAIVNKELEKYNENQKYLRGVYCGGTFAEESLIYLNKHNPGMELYCNLNTSYAIQLEDHLHSKGHALIDLGSEEFTLDAPHPVFDPELRLKRFRQEAADPETAVILLDFITAPGVHEDPVLPFAQACAEAIKARKGALTVIASICGSANDPQDITKCGQALIDAGVILTGSNHQSTLLASALAHALDQRR
jgi:succinyl-CoA synthetase alpha subunit